MNEAQEDDLPPCWVLCSSCPARRRRGKSWITGRLVLFVTLLFFSPFILFALHILFCLLE